MESDFQAIWQSADSLVKVLGPFAGMYFAARVIISYQKDLLGSLAAANADLRSQVKEQDERIEHLEGVVNELHQVQLECDQRNNELDLRNRVLISAVRAAGIVVPEIPETHREDPPS